ncbi:MAG: hypothetical protein WCY36_00290 [Candidatus Omnitrophota bacterium]
MANNIDVSKLPLSKILILFGDLMDELKKRGVVRTRNNPVADYAEWLTVRVFSLGIQTSSNKGFDAIDKKGIRYQIKGRRLDASNPSRQLGVIRDLDKKGFDFLIAIIFNKDFTIHDAYKIPHELIGEYARYSKHQNGYILHLKGKILLAKGVENITGALSKVSA